MNDRNNTRSQYLLRHIRFLRKQCRFLEHIKSRFRQFRISTVSLV
jgi:hypothetical protein